MPPNQHPAEAQAETLCGRTQWNKYMLVVLSAYQLLVVWPVSRKVLHNSVQMKTHLLMLPIFYVHCSCIKTPCSM